jgi:hypothetical protein
MPHTLASCVDDAQLVHIDCNQLGRSTFGFGAAGSNKFSHGQVLCPGLRALQNASCATLSSVHAVAALIAPVAREPVCCKLGWAGMAQGSHELAVAMVQIARLSLSGLPRSEPVRFVATNAGNGWLALVVATYLQRVHGGSLHGLLVGDGKSEWAQAGDVRKLMYMVGLSYRKTLAFDPLAELALLNVSPAPNRAIMPHADRRARALLPRRWVGRPTPFSVCLRVGSPLDLEGLSRDFGGLAPVCRLLGFWSGPSGGGERVVSTEDRMSQLRFPGANFHLDAFASAGALRPSAHRAGNWTLLIAHPPAQLHFENDYVDPPPPPPPPPSPRPPKAHL